MSRREPPQTEEGWYVLHDFRTIDWDGWRAAPERERDRAIEEGVDYLRDHEALTDADAGGSAVFSVLGHDADLMLLHLRPSIADLDTAERRFEQTAFAGFTEQTDSYLSVTEVSGYMSQEYFEGEEVEDTGMANYIESRLEPDIPDSEYVSFYPMDKRRGPENNWYDLPFDERADLMSGHGDIGRDYAGKVTQIITGSVGLDDYEWGVTLFADDPAQIKKLLYEMRFDPSSSRFGEFGRFRFGRRFPPEDLGAVLAGEPVPTGDDHHAGADTSHGEGSPHGDHGDETSEDESETVRDVLDEEGIYAGQPHGEDVHAMVLYSEADPDELADDVSGLRGNFEHYDTHVKTAVYGNNEARSASDASSAERSSANRSSGQSPREDGETASTDGGESAVVSIWDTASAAETAGGFLSDLPGIVARGRGDGDDGFGTMGMFYTTKPDQREAFVERFDTVTDLLAEMDGHDETDLLVNRENENDMFIASRWRSREDAMAFFRSDEFRETVSFGREVLADRPRHVFLA
ncbi:heme-binding protein [Halococcus qingdaonensis]|uniref:heme-binding protein n=1 Tax=Halococcus qingdaonensis TaxID=224402 RepID=UPI0021167C02|nr:heme-binding protein [Halococcus qingdaonensis]